MSKEYWYVNMNTGGGFTQHHYFWADGWVEACRGRLVQFQKTNGRKISFATERILSMLPIDPPKKQKKE